MYFVVWGALIWILGNVSDRQDRTPELNLDRRLRQISGPGLVLYGLSVTAAAVDWVMSLDPHWVSTIYGLLFIGGQGLLSFSFVVIVAAALVRYAPMKDIIKPGQFLDHGKLMMAFVMLWGYFAFSQWLLIWSGNLPEEITWYINRTRGGWQYVALALIIGQFAVPFALLLSHGLKTNAQQLTKLALWIVLMRYVDVFWFISPNFPDRAGHFHFSWLDAVVPLALGGLWMALFFYYLKRRPLLALYDAHVRVLLEEGHEHEQRAAS